MVPSRRLATLLDQARRHQQQDCVFHDDGNASSLYLDHECSSGQFPDMTTHILADHTDEVWKLEWSPDGTMLASAGKDHMVVLWQFKVCRPHTYMSRADRQVVTAEDGKRSISVAPVKHLSIEPRRDEWTSDGIDAIAWSPDGKTIAAASFDKLGVWKVPVSFQCSFMSNIDESVW
jgi:WD40 repeat protein